VLPNTAAAERTVDLEIVATDAALTTEQAQALNVTEKLSSFTQPFDYAEYREVNVGRAAEYMDGVVLKPGDVYSMNGTILERTEANGYVSGTFISGGRFEEGLGGGVSIATTATWTAAFFAGLEAIEVNPHSLYISRYQPGLEATVAWGFLDLKFGNNTGNGVLITTDAGPTFITVEMWGTKVYDDIYDVSSERYNITPYTTQYDNSPECSSQGGVNGFTIDVTRVFEQGNEVVDEELFTTRYDPTTRFICGSPPAPAPPPSPTPDGDSSPSPSG
jgi:vancomycin resistance protein YoaR